LRSHRRQSGSRWNERPRELATLALLTGRANVTAHRRDYWSMQGSECTK
jgi:hypothetical protein